ncbi:MAG: type II secretion system protein GspL [Methylococcaceae bacterium]|nr:type II secretion system protein GspL [Methylococcaceae bacterium]
MAETLLVRFSQHTPENPEWLDTSTPNNQPQSGTWRDLADAAKGKAIVLLLPASAVLLLEIELPVKSNAQLKKALPFALEDLLADDVETYHLAWFRQPQDKLAVAAVTHEKLAAFIEPFRQAGIALEGIYPETLCLPYQQGSCSLLVDGELAILRTGQWRGGGIETGFLPQFLGKLSEEGGDGPFLRVWARQVPADLPFEYIEEPFSTPLQTFAHGLNAAAELNLLSGPYAPETKGGGRWQAWLPALVIALMALTLQVGGLLNQAWQQQTELKALETQTLDLFKQTFPEVKRVVNVKAQADQQLLELKKQGSHAGSGFMRILYRSGEFIKDNPGLQLRKMNYLNGGLQMQLSATDIGLLEQFKQQLQTSLLVKIQSADSGANGVEAQLEIREK